MNILVFADSHSAAAGLDRIAGQVRPDMIFHLGDNVRDTRFLRPYAPVVAVRGNCDNERDTPEETLLELEGIRILLTHGHRQRVKLSLDSLWFSAREKGATLALFGHTHVAFHAEKDGVTLFNPGSIGEPRRGGPSYGIVRLSGGTASCEHVWI